MAKVTTNTTDLRNDEEIVISKRNNSKNLPIPPYMTLGRSGVSRHNIKGLDAVSVIKSLSKNSAWFFWLLVTYRDFETNLCRTDRDLHLNNKEKGRVPRAYKELSSKSLVVRQRRGIYRINPKAVLPNFKCFEKIWNAWMDECQEKGVKPGDSNENEGVPIDTSGFDRRPGPTVSLFAPPDTR